jgi:DNA-binding NtrC family response regulator
LATTSRILVVDDEQPIRDLVSLMLQEAGYSVKTAENGRAAIALCAAESFDLVLTDVTMPEVNGHELAQWVAAHCPATRTALMSGFDAGCQGCVYSPRCKLIAKPFLPAQIVEFVREALAP